jgi:hypothetical protein
VQLTSSQKYADVFDGIGKLAEPVTREIDESVKPIIDNPRRIPIAVQPALEEIITENRKYGCYRKNHSPHRLGA